MVANFQFKFCLRQKNNNLIAEILYMDIYVSHFADKLNYKQNLV